FIAPNENFQFFEEPGFVHRGVLPPQRGEHLLDQDHSPTLVVSAVRIGFADRFRGVPLLSVVSIQKNEGLIASTLKSAGPFPFVNQKVLHRPKEESAEFAAVPIG